MKIYKDEEIIKLAGGQESIIVFGKLPLVRILLRYLKKEGLLDKVAGASVQGNQKRQGTLVGCPVHSMKELSQTASQSLVFVVEEKEERQQNACKVLEGLGYSDIAVVEYALMSQLGAREHVHLDFICVGFVKCGTTSLHAALKKNKDIFLPKKKETLYMGWRNRFDDAPERFNSIYFNNVPEGKVVGNVEPSYHARADGIYECYGEDTKVIFMVRNPASATYSYFKMLMRKTEEMRQINYYKKYRRFDVRMFDDYIRDYILSREDTRFCYMDWIDQYLKYYDKDKIKVVIFEELIRDPEKVMNEIQDFIGVKRVKFVSLPHSNEGKSVSKNYISARINRYLYRRDRELRYVTSEKEKKRHNARKEKIHKYTLIDNEEKMLPSSKATLDDFYRDSIHRLEDFCGKSLKGLWY